VIYVKTAGVDIYIYIECKGKNICTNRFGVLWKTSTEGYHAEDLSINGRVTVEVFRKM
jgi:hypothetical protein